MMKQIVLDQFQFSHILHSLPQLKALDNDNDNDNENHLLTKLYREKHVINTIHIASYV